MNDLALRRRARAAFWRGRAREAFAMVTVAAVFVAAAIWLADRSTQAAPFGVLLVVTSGFFAFVGRDAGRAVLPAMLLGALPLACALCARHWGHFCTGSGCVSLCVPLCTVGGLGAGTLLARFARGQPHPWRSWSMGAVIVASAGAMGCACVGMTGVAGMVVGLVVPQLIGRAAARA